MASYLLLNTTVLGTTTFPAGSAIDGNSDPVDQLRAAGAVLLSTAHLTPSLVAGAERARQARSRGASYQTLDQVMQSALAGDTSRLGGGSVFVYREGEQDPGGNVFSSFAEAHAAAVQVRPSSILVDPALGSPEIPDGSGSFDMLNVGLLGFGPLSNLTVGEGVTLPGLGLVSRTILTSTSSSPVLEVQDGLVVVLDFGAALSTAAPSSAPFAHVGSSVSFCNFLLRYFSFLFSYDVSAPVIDVDLGGMASVGTDIAVVVFDDVLAGDGAVVVDDLTGIAVLNRNPNISHVQLGTNITYVFG